MSFIAAKRRGMAKKRERKRAKSKEKPQAVKESPPKQAIDSTDEFDFGGLPERNLKKNLGC